MKSKRLNLIGAVRAGLEARGYSTVKLVNAVNAELGKLEAVETTSKLGDGSVGRQGVSYGVTESVSVKYKTDVLTIPLLFDAWHGVIAKANRLAESDIVDIPQTFRAWLDKFAKADAEKPADKDKDKADKDADKQPA